MSIVATTPPPELVERVAELLGLDHDKAATLAANARRLYEDRLTTRFSSIKVRDRIKRTNAFLLSIRGVSTVAEWADRQVRGALLASEEEAVGHFLEAIAKACHPGAAPPRFPDDFDYEVSPHSTRIEGYQVKLSWDCMPMSSRKNLSRTIETLREQYANEGKEFIGYFAPCYGKMTTTSPPGQAYVSLSSREFWTRVGGGDVGFDAKVGEAVGCICGQFRSRLQAELIPDLVRRLAEASRPIIGTDDGALDMQRVFRAVNR